MESVNQTIIDALHFISFVEDAFIKKRQFVETLNLQEYNHYVKERNKGVKKIVKALPKEREPVQLIKKVEDKQVSIEVEELALVDTLLERARNVRMKNMELLKGTKDCSNKSQTFADSFLSKSNKLELQHKLCMHKNIKESNGDKRVIPRSKSSLISSTVKTALVPRSKSANAYQVSKDVDKVPKTNETVTKMCNPKNKCPNKRNEQKTFDKISLAVLSNKELKDFKKLFSDQNDCGRQIKDKFCIENCNTPFSSDCFQFSSLQSCLPTYRKFQNELKLLYVSKSCFKLHPGVIWYPYLNVKNKNYLCSVKQFESFDNLKKTMEILHKIQEAMVWIDILNFVGKALFKLQLLDKNDECVIRVSSYLSSICRQDLQKAPIC